MKDLYLDANAHVPLSKSAQEAYCEFDKSLASHGHPLSPSVVGRQAADALEIARGKIAKLIGAKMPSQIVFTNSCSQACEWAIAILSKQKRHNIVSAIEHPAVTMPAKQYFKEYETIPVTEKGVILLPDLDGLPVTVSCIHVQNEIGTIQPIEEIRRAFPEAIIFSDMSQSPGKVNVNVTELGVDIATFGAHKFGGPSGVGFMYLKDSLLWTEFGTGSRYFMDIPGTPNVAGVVATAAALEEAIETLPERSIKMAEFRVVLERGLKELGFDIIGEGTNRCPNTTFARVPCQMGHNNSGLSLMLELGDIGVYGVHVGLGSACGSLHSGGSPLMEALGQPSDGQDYIRISQWGQYGAEEANYLLTRIQNVMY
jgi:cysteine desulfurase